MENSYFCFVEIEGEFDVVELLGNSREQLMEMFHKMEDIKVYRILDKKVYHNFVETKSGIEYDFRGRPLEEKVRQEFMKIMYQ